MKRIVPFVLLALFVCSCSAPPPADVAQVRKTIEAMSQKSAKDMVAGTWDTTMAMFTEDAISMPNYMPLSRGKHNIKEQYRQMMSSGMKFLSADFKTTDVQVSGDWAFEVGTYSMTMEMPSMGKMSDAGKYLTIYERSHDGTWKTKVETWNNDKPPAMPEKAG
jgi:ketosteroid isomerase-like protein